MVGRGGSSCALRIHRKYGETGVKKAVRRYLNIYLATHWADDGGSTNFHAKLATGVICSEIPVQYSFSNLVML